MIMEKIKLSSKGQLSIPKHIRDRMNLNKGDVFTIEEKEGVLIIHPAKTTFKDLGKSLYSKKRKPKTDKEIREAVSDASVRRYKRHQSITK
jgi:antitoxin PrlF